MKSQYGKIEEKIEIKKAYSKDFEKVIPVLIETFGTGINSKEKNDQVAKKFEYLFNNNWNSGEEHVGYKLEKPNGEIVGFWACIFSVRYLNDIPHKFCNFSTWAVKKNYRHCSLLLTKAVHDLKDYSFTILSPDKTSIEVFTKLYKFKPLEKNLVFIPALPCLGKLEKSEFIFFSGKGQPPQSLKKEHVQLIKDHSKFNAHFFFIHKGNDYCLLIIKRRKIRNLPFSYIYFISDPEIFQKYLSQIRFIVNKQLKTIAMASESRNFRFGLPFLSFKKELPRPFLFKSKHLTPNEIDALYSEYFLLQNI